MARRNRRRLGAGLISLVLAVLAVTAGFVGPGMLPQARAAVKSVYIPSRWVQTGEVPWVQERTRQSNNFILLWGDQSGTDPRNAPSQFRFDPDNILSQLESIYNST